MLKVESILGSWRLESIQSISTVLPFQFQSHSQLPLVRRACDGWVWASRLVWAEHKDHQNGPQSVWMLLREPFGFHVPVNMSGREMGTVRLSPGSLDRGLKTSQLVIYHWSRGQRLPSLPPLTRYVCWTQPSSWACALVSRQMKRRPLLDTTARQRDKWEEHSEKVLPARTVGIFQWRFWCLWHWQLLRPDCKIHWF